MNLAIVGGGSWGTALAIVLAPRFEAVRLWVYERDLAGRIQSARVNDVYLPGFRVPENLAAGHDLAWALQNAEIVLGVMPSQHARMLYREMVPHVTEEAILVSATKGLERGSLLRMSEVIEDAFNDRFKPNIAILSGPTFAREVAQGEPAAVVIASARLEIARRVQSAFSGRTFRLYTNDDPIGVEIGASLKNVVAIAAGVCQGLELGHNTQAALITRGLAEISRLAVAMGGQPKTLSGLAGLGDLVLTCSGDLSRNRRVGIELAKGRCLAEIVAETSMVAEGVETCEAAVALGERLEVDLPIIRQMHAVLYASKAPRDAIRDLMDRALKSE